MSIDSMTKLYYNNIKQSGVCLEECEHIIEVLNPNLVKGIKKKFSGVSKLNNYRKVV
jgi:hypothetical protein